jgi:hypothetical protein
VYLKGIQMWTINLHNFELRSYEGENNLASLVQKQSSKESLVVQLHRLPRSLSGVVRKKHGHHGKKQLLWSVHYDTSKPLISSLSWCSATKATKGSNLITEKWGKYKHEQC